MITFNNTKTLYDLVKRVGLEFENNVFIRYEKDDVIYEKGYGIFTLDTLAIGAYTEKQNKKFGHPIHAAIIGKCGYEYLTVLMGVPCAGGITYPVDIQASNETLVENLEKAEMDIVFYDRDFTSQVDYIKNHCSCVKKFICLQSVNNVRTVPQIHKSYRSLPIENKPKVSDCAMIIFTSGTTGHGKGVMLSHANIIDNMFCTDGFQDVSLNVLPINHIFCISSDIMLVLRYGSTLCLCDDLKKMFYYIQLFKPTAMRIVPMMAKMFVNRVAMAKSKNPNCSIREIKEEVLGPRLVRLVSGGGYLSPELATALMDLDITCAQGYGMSECSPKISVPDYDRPDKLDSVGKLVTGCEVRIVDNEIQVKSPSVMMGYYNDPELTKEAITEDGWLCTGDLGYLDEEGFLYLNGRKKNLIILSNGENVSPEMIEKKFDKDTLVTDIVAYGQGDRIVAEVYPNFDYINANNVQDVLGEVKKLVTEHNEELPTYARISDVTIRKAPFPKTASKKIQRDKFLEEKANQEKKQSTLRLPETEMQQKIHNLCAKVIGHTDFSIDEDLYQVGLDSLGSMMLIADFADVLELNITLTELMEHKTVEELESFFGENESKETIDLSVRPVYPLTSLQMYFAYVIPDNTTGNLPFAFQMDKGVNLERMREACHKVLDAHPGLKGIIKPTPQKYYALYRDDSRIIDIPIQQVNDEDVPALMQSLIVPFRYREDDNLVHIYLFEGQKHNYLFFDVAHIMGDGVTMNVLMEDLNKAYAGEELVKEKYTAYEYALEEQERKNNGILEKDTRYVAGLMHNHKMNRSLLNKNTKEDLQTGVYGSIRKEFKSLPRNEFLYYGKKHGVSENAMFIAAFNYVVSLFSDENDVFCSSIHSGRTDNRWNRLAGCLFETYYCRYTKVAHEKTNELISRTGNQIMETMKNLVPCNREGEMFIQFQGDLLETPQIGNLPTERVKIQLDSLPFHLQIMYNKNGYYIELRYWENRFDRDVLEIFLTCYEAVLLAMLNENSVRLLKTHLPENVYPTKYTIEAGELNRAIGYDFIQNVDDDQKLRVYVLDDDLNKKPFGAWGRFYIMNAQPVEFTNVGPYPFGPGVVYQTALTARILPDGTLDFLHNSGRTVLTDGAHGRRYFELAEIEKLLTSREEIQSAYCYMVYDPMVRDMSLKAEITLANHVSKEAFDTNALSEELQASHGDMFAPKFWEVKC
ncbi:MAG: AMP-binding protein [Bacillota bacterium]|nr:AMP-binding protein [Bacillota bacterium]